MTKFELASDLALPADLVQLLKDAWDKHYPALYEKAPDPRNVGDTDDSFRTVLSRLFAGELGHKRVVQAGYILATTARLTVCRYSSDTRFGEALSYVEQWLAMQPPPAKRMVFFHEASTFGGSQVVSENMFVFQELVESLHHKGKAVELVADVSSLCVEGYAIIPGGDGRRDLFNWWLVWVIPAAYALTMPRFMYTVDLPWPPRS